MPALRLVMRMWLGLIVLLVLFCTMRRLHAQAMTTASGPGMYISVGGGVTVMETGYGERALGGSVMYIDANISPRLGAEAETKFLRVHTSENVRQDTYLAGVRYALPDRRLQPYAKVLSGLGRIQFPFGYASGSYLVFAGGAGVDYHFAGRWTARVIDAEFQNWPQFTFGSLNAYGLSAGLSFRVTGIELFPKGTRHRH